MPRKPSRKVLNCVQITHKQDDEDGPSQVSVTSHSSTSSQETLDVDQADQVSIQEPLTSRPTRAAKVKFLQQVPQLVVTDTHLDTVEKIKTEPSSQEYDQLCEVTASDSIADQMPNMNDDIVYEFDSIDGITSKDIKTEDNVLEEEYEVRRVLKMEIDVESEGIQQTTFEENNLMVDSNKVQDIIEDAMQELLEEQQREDIVDATSIDTTTENAGKLLNRRKYRAKLKAKKLNKKQKRLDSGSVEYYITEDDEVKNVKTKPSSEESELLCYNSATTRISDSLLAPRPTRAAKVKCLQLISEAVSYDSSSDENPVASHHRHQQHEGAEVHLHGLKEIQQCSSEYGHKDNSEQRELSEEKLRQLAIKHVDALRVICHRINIRQFTSKYKIKESVEQDEQHLPKIIDCVRTQTVSEHHEKHELQDVSTRVANEYVVQHEQDLEEQHELILRERKRYSKNADTHPHTVETIKTETSNQEYDQLCDVTASDSIADPKPNVNSENNTLCECDPLGGISGNEFNTEDNILEKEYESKEVIKMEIDIVSEGPQQIEPKEGKTSMVGVIKVVNINNIQKPLEKQRKTDIDNASNKVVTSKFAEKKIIKKIRPALQQCPKQTRQDMSVLSRKPLEKQRKGDIDNTTNIVATSKSAEKIIIKKIRPVLQQCPKQTRQDVPIIIQKPLEKQRKGDIDNATNIAKQTRQDVPILVDNRDVVVHDSRQNIVCQYVPTYWSRNYVKKGEQHLPKLREVVSTQIVSLHVDHNHQNTSKYTANENIKAHVQRKEIERQHCVIKVKDELSFGLRQRRNEKALQRYLKIIANESPEERKQRKETKRQKRLQREANESVEQRKQRLQRERQNKLKRKANESVEQREQRRQRERQSFLKWMANESAEKREQRRQREKQKILQRKANETVEQRDRRRESQRRYYVRKVKDQLNVEKLEQHREKRRQYYLTKMKGQESVEKRQLRNEKARQWRLKRKANESVEEREQRLQRSRQKILQRKANETVEQCEQRLEKQRQYYLTKVKGQRSVKNLNPSGVHVLTDDI